eukprot:TRINITY_DN2848_c0_g1_i1.p1 TRINITY_DN2848_c0_g1~~TRINITY_DN2848_c0_g1_i1.p1  ORF type:complete len:913 (+),score=191.91 TRINITY_DN2848_c0_g1_i1:155-2893(+)
MILIIVITFVVAFGLAYFLFGFKKTGVVVAPGNTTNVIQVPSSINSTPVKTVEVQPTTNITPPTINVTTPAVSVTPVGEKQPIRAISNPRLANLEGQQSSSAPSSPVHSTLQPTVPTLNINSSAPHGKGLSPLKRGHTRSASTDSRSRTLKAPAVDRTKFDQSELADLAPLKKVFVDPNIGVPLREGKARTTLGNKTFKSCFVGSEAVDWIINNVTGVDRSKATEIGLRMWASGLFYGVPHKSRPFTDDSHLFRFNSRNRSSGGLPPAHLISSPSVPELRKSVPVLQQNNSLSNLKVPISARSDKSSAASPKSARFKGILKKGRRKSSKMPVVHASSEEAFDFSSNSISSELKRSELWVDIQTRTGLVKKWIVLDHFKPVPEDSNEIETWCIRVYNQVQNASVKDLLTKLTKREKEGGLRIKDRRSKINKLKIYKRSFKGKEAVEWLLSTHESNNRPDAVALMNSLMLKGVIANAGTENNHSDQYHDNSTYFKLRVTPEDFSSTSPTSNDPIAVVLIKPGVQLSLKEDSKRAKLSLYNKEGGSVYETIHHQSLDIQNKSIFEISLPAKYDRIIKQWVVALESANMLGDESFYNLSAPNTSDEYSLEDASDEGMDEGESFSEVTSSDIGPEGKSEEEVDAMELLGEPEPVVAIDILSQAERVAVNEFRTQIEQLQANGELKFLTPELTTDPELLKYLRCRRLVVPDALKLLRESVPFRQANNLLFVKINQTGPSLLGLAGNGEGTLIKCDPNARDKMGRAILNVLIQHYVPKNVPPMDMVRGVVYVMDEMMKLEEISKLGFSVFVDCKGSSYSNFDKNLPRVILDAIVSKYPARIGYVVITNVPWFFKFVWAIMRPLLSEQLAQKFHIVGQEDMGQFVDGKMENIIQELGGTSTYNHGQWIQEKRAKEAAEGK